MHIYDLIIVLIRVLWSHRIYGIYTHIWNIYIYEYTYMEHTHIYGTHIHTWNIYVYIKGIYWNDLESAF